MKIAFILDHRLHHYRTPFFKQLAEKGYEISIYHTGPEIEIDTVFINQIIVKSTNVFKAFEWFKLPNLNSNDVVVVMQNIRLLNLWSLSFNFRRKYKLIHWGIGVSSANGLKLKKTIASRLRNILAKYSDALILYSDYPLPLFFKEVQVKTFIANNTVYNKNIQDFSSEQKNSFLFIGTLNKRKGLDILLHSFTEFKSQINNDIKLVIIGDGPESENLKKMAQYLGVDCEVQFTGAISEQIIKEKYFESAIVSISPKQAGLSVLESFSYGVPFIAYKNAISGGEHLNIVNNYNGFLVNNQSELTNKLVELFENRDLAKELGHNAYEYYKEKRQMKHMVNTFHEAFKFVLSK